MQLLPLLVLLCQLALLPLLILLQKLPLLLLVLPLLRKFQLVLPGQLPRHTVRGRAHGVLGLQGAPHGRL